MMTDLSKPINFSASSLRLVEGSVQMINPGELNFTYYDIIDDIGDSIAVDDVVDDNASEDDHNDCDDEHLAQKMMMMIIVMMWS